MLASELPVFDGVTAIFITFEAGETNAPPVALLSVALAGEVARTPAPRATTATSAMRLRSVFVDMFFLSLVEIGHFPISARRSCEIF
jgi:hypothetical protein